MATGLIDVMKRASLDAVENAKMCDLRYGTVVSVSPLKVQVTTQFTIPSSLLIIPQHLTDYSVEVSVDWSTVSVDNHTHTMGLDSTSANGEHSHGVTGKKKMTIHNALKIGDKVALLRKQGGQSYFILDRI